MKNEKGAVWQVARTGGNVNITASGLLGPGGNTSKVLKLVLAEKGKRTFSGLLWEKQIFPEVSCAWNWTAL